MKDKDGLALGMNFEEKIAFGNIAELEIAKILVEGGYFVIRSYDYVGKGENNKAPRMYGKIANLILPDLDACKEGKRTWIECKHYTDTPFNRKFQIFVHGIKLRHYKHYLEVEKVSGCAVMLFIKEIKNNEILYARLKTLKTYPCLFFHEHSDSCLIYFNRDDFKVIPLTKKPLPPVPG